MKQLFFTLFICCFFFSTTNAQDINGNEVVLNNIAKRVYNIEKFEGVKLFELENEKYLVVAVKIEKKNNSQSILNTLANIKAKAYLSKYQNGSYVATELVVISNDSVTKSPVTNEIMKEFSSGFVKGVGALSNIDEVEPGFKVFFFYSKI
jgi:hypothetical protein